VGQVVATILHEVQKRLEETGRPGISYKDFRNFFVLLPQNDMLVDYFVSARCPGICETGACAVVLRDANPRVGGHPTLHSSFLIMSLVIKLFRSNDFSSDLVLGGKCLFRALTSSIMLIVGQHALSCCAFGLPLCISLGHD
jgi:hypothetical protein